MKIKGPPCNKIYVFFLHIVEMGRDQTHLRDLK